MASVSTLGTGAPTTWTREQVEGFLRRENLGYQKIELPYGLATPGEDRTQTAEQIFGAELRGRTVLDVGSYLGYFCLTALDRGAARAVGWEIDPVRLRQARAIAEMRGARAEYHEYDLEGPTPETRYDIVLCLNVLQHTRDPLAALDKLVRMTRERLVLEVPSFGEYDRRTLRWRRWKASLVGRWPVIVVGRPSSGPRRQRRFYFTAPAVRELLLEHRCQFARLDVLPSSKDRLLVAAHRRRVDGLVLVAGPSHSGKSRLIRELVGGRLPGLASRLGAPPLAGCPVVEPETIRRLTSLRVPLAVLEYDLLRPQMLACRLHERDDVLQMAEDAAQVWVATLWADPAPLPARFGEQARSRPPALRSALRAVVPEALRRRLRTAEPSPTAACSRRDRPSAGGHLDLPEMVETYRRWLAYCGARLAGRIRSNLIVEYDGREAAVRSPEEWEGTIGASAGGWRGPA